MCAPLPIGRIVRPRGLRGELIARLYNEASEVLKAGRAVMIRSGASEPRAVLVTGANRLPRGWALTLDGVADRSAAEELVGCELLVEREGLPAPADGEYYWEEIRGFAVKTVSGRSLGHLASLFHTNVDILVIKGEDGEYMIPVVEGFVERIDHERRLILVDPPEGLL